MAEPLLRLEKLAKDIELAWSKADMRIFPAEKSS